MRLALKFAYLGGPFHGYQRQPGLRTVEGDILEAMVRLGIAADPGAARFRSASRTDAGVSALGNVIAVDTDFRPRGICRALNSQLEDIWFWGVAAVDASFDPRRARERWYRYHLPPGLDLEALRRCARLFIGRHDFRAFTRARACTVGEIRSIIVRPGAHGPVVDLRAPFFLWNLVRRIVGAMEAHARGRRSLEEIQGALATGQPGTGLAPAAPLVLMDVHYDVEFVVQIPRPTVLEATRELASLRARMEVLRGLSMHP